MIMPQARNALSNFWDEEFGFEDFESEDLEISRTSREYVRWVQQSLARLMGAKLDVDGVIGPRTREVIRAFQTRQGLPADGSVGPVTEAAMVKAGAAAPPSGATPSMGANARVDTELPRAGVGFYSYHPKNPERQYGTADTIGALRAIGQAWASRRPSGPRIGIGDISFRGGGKMSPHVSHDKGVDADLRLVRADGKEAPVTYRDAAYSRELTQALVDTIRANGVLAVKYIFFNDPAVKGVQPWKGHDDHLHVRFLPGGATVAPAPKRPTVTPKAPAKPPSGTARAPVKKADPDVASALRRWNMPTGIPSAPLFFQLVERHRPKHFPLPLLVAFSSLEASGWNDATHGTQGNRWTSPAFYELGVFQVPAGLHGLCSSGRFQDCQQPPPGADPHRKSPWFKLCDALGLDPSAWTDPTTQVRVGMQNLENDAATVRARFPSLFPDKGSDWALRASVLMPFGPGIGYTLNLLKKHRSTLEAMPEPGRWAFLRMAGARTENVDAKMTRARKLAAALGQTAAMPAGA
jgi:hypothetical protein